MTRPRRIFPGSEEDEPIPERALIIRQFFAGGAVDIPDEFSALTIHVMRLIAGGGIVILDDLGITVLNKDIVGQASINSYAFRNEDGTITAALYGSDTSTGTEQNQVDLQINREATHKSQLNITAEAPSGKTATITLTADDENDTPDISIQAGGAAPGVSTSGPLFNINTDVAILPRRTTTQRDALTAVNGMILYNTSNNRIEAYENGSWVDL
jgi:hypothetical protein